MKCDELNAYKGDVNIPVYGSIADADVYLKKDVDAAIAELKQKLMPCINGDCILTCEVVEKYGKENAELKQKLDKAIAERDGNKVCIDALKAKLAEKDKEIALLKERICNGDVSRATWIDDCFDKDMEIKELKAQSKMREKEIEFMHSNCQWHAGDGCSRLHGELMAATSEIAELKQKLENVQASMYCDVVDANMEIRRLKRTLYKACANWADVVAFEKTEGIGHDNSAAERWRKMESKCLKKTESYK